MHWMRHLEVIEAADVTFLKRKTREMRVAAKDASLAHADVRLEELRSRVRALEGVKAVVTVRTRPQKS